MSLVNNIPFSPEDYAAAAVLADEVADEMLMRLEWMTIKPRIVVDLGCGIGKHTTELRKRYADAMVFALDTSMTMLEVAQQQKLSCVCADVMRLPFASQSVDLLFANLVFPWQADITAMLRECHRVLHPEGLLIFSALGLDTLRELQEIAKPSLMDMHDVGDLLLQQFADPVLDVNYYTLNYADQSKMFRELQLMGMIGNIPQNISLTADDDGKWPVTFEVIIAHAFAPEMKRAEDGVVRIPVSQLREQLRRMK